MKHDRYLSRIIQPKDSDNDVENDNKDPILLLSIELELPISRVVQSSNNGFESNKENQCRRTKTKRLSTTPTWTSTYIKDTRTTILQKKSICS